MKKNIIIIILALLTFTSIVYANIKANEATKQKTIAEANARNAQIQSQKALDCAADAMRFHTMAEAERERAAMAIQEANTIMADLKKCKSGR